MAEDWEVWRMRLVTRAPVHVGRATQEVGPMEVAVAGGRAFWVSEDRLLAALAERGLVDRFLIAALQGEGQFSLQEFLTQHDLLTTSFLQQVAITSARIEAENPGTIRKFRPFVRDGFGRPYIPGSSIKGALRTAILYMTLARMEERSYEELEAALLDPVDRELSRAAALRAAHGRVPVEVRKFFFRPMERGLLQRLRLAWHGRRKPEHQQATPEQQDLLRCLRVSDTTPWDPSGLVIHEVRILSLRAGDRQAYLKDPPLYVECLPAGAELTFTLTLDRRLLHDLRAQNPGRVFVESLSDVLAFAREFSGDVAVFEEEYLRVDSLQRPLLDWYRHSDGLDLRLGWGTGWHGTTIGLLLKDSQQQRVRDLFFAHPRRSTWIPKSRRVVVKAGQPVSPLGWVSLERIG